MPERQSFSTPEATCTSLSSRHGKESFQQHYNEGGCGGDIMVHAMLELERHVSQKRNGAEQNVSSSLLQTLKVHPLSAP